METIAQFGIGLLLSVISVEALLCLPSLNPKVVGPKMTSSGCIYGCSEQVQGKEIVAYKGVPFAPKPRRFKPAESPQGWEFHEVKAFDYGPPCMGYIDEMFPGFYGAEMWNADRVKMSEDCMNLNIWAPRKAWNLPVIVWIFGGGFFSGSPSLDVYDGKTLAAVGNAIVVNINYRLGPFGFLNLDDESTNLGLRDQQLALQWIKANIAKFGGDPDCVTLFGESSGAASVSAHLFAPNSADLFRKVVMLSGSITAPWSTRPVDDAKDHARQFLKDICTEPDNDQFNDQQLLDCAREHKIDAQTIQTAANSASFPSFMEFTFVPVPEDNVFFHSNVFQKLNGPNFKNAPMILGRVKDEASYWLPYYLPDDFTTIENGTRVATDALPFTEEQFESALTQAFSGTYYDYDQASLDLIRDNYLPKTIDPENKGSEYRDAVQTMLADFLFACPTLDFADEVYQQQANPIYAYFFNQRSMVNPWPQWMGTMHGYEIEYFFGEPLSNSSFYSESEKAFSRRVMGYLASFATQSISKPMLLNDGSQPGDIPEWPAYNQTRQFLRLEITKPEQGWIGQRGGPEDDCVFWKSLGYSRPKREE